MQLSSGLIWAFQSGGWVILGHYTLMCQCLTYSTTEQHSVAWPKEGLPTDPSMPCGEGSELELLGRSGKELVNRGFLPPAVPTLSSALLSEGTVVIKKIDEEPQIVPLSFMCPPGVPITKFSSP